MTSPTATGLDGPKFNPILTGAIWQTIRHLPAAHDPDRVQHVFDLILLHLGEDTGEILLTPAQMAAQIGCDAVQCDQAFGLLAEMQAIFGVADGRWFINPDAAWQGSLASRQAAVNRRKPPSLRLIDSGTSPMPNR